MKCALASMGFINEDVQHNKNLSPDIVLWPVYTDFNYNEWNESMKYEYAEQAGKVGGKVLYINSFCKDKDGDDSLLYAENCIGAFTRGESLEVALQKMPAEIRSYHSWMGTAEPDTIEPVIVQEEESNLEIKDADSDVLFVIEEEPLTYEE